MKTLAALGPDVVLATINVDTFRDQFVAEDQAAILEPMEHALRRRRGADENQGDDLEAMEHGLGRKRERRGADEMDITN